MTPPPIVAAPASPADRAGPRRRPLRARRIRRRPSLALAGGLLVALIVPGVAGLDAPAAEQAAPRTAADVALAPRLPGPLETVGLVMRLLEEDRPEAAGWFLATVPGATAADRTAAAALFGQVTRRTGRRLVGVRAFTDEDAAVVLAWEGPRDAELAAVARTDGPIDLGPLVLVRRDRAWRLVDPQLAATPALLELAPETIARITRLLDAAEAAKPETVAALRTAATERAEGAAAEGAAAEGAEGVEQAETREAAAAAPAADEAPAAAAPGSIAAVAPDAAAMARILGPGWERAPGILVEDASRPIEEQPPGVTPTLLEVLRTARVRAAIDLSWARRTQTPGLVTARLFRFEDEAAAAAWWGRQAGGLEAVDPPAAPGGDVPHAARSTPEGRVLAGRIGAWTFSVRSVGADVHGAVFEALWPRIAARARSGTDGTDDDVGDPAPDAGDDAADG